MKQIFKLNLYDISYKVDEPTYRKHPAFSYSFLKKAAEAVEKKDLSLLDTPIKANRSLTIGSMVDCLLTESVSTYDKKYLVYTSQVKNKHNWSLNLDQITWESYRYAFEEFCKDNLKKGYSQNLEGLLGGPDQDPKNAPLREEMIKKFFKIKDDEEYSDFANFKIVELINLLTWAPYYNYYKQGVTIVPESWDYIAQSAASSLLKDEKSSVFLGINNLFDAYYQLKFVETFEGIEFKCMADVICIDHFEKIIYPIDLKTSARPEKFEESFYKFKYHIQARLYWKIIRKVLDKNGFQDYTLAPYTFIAVGNTIETCKTVTVYTFPFTKAEGNIKIGRRTLQDPIEIAKDFINFKQQVTNGKHAEN